MKLHYFISILFLLQLQLVSGQGRAKIRFNENWHFTLQDQLGYRLHDIDPQAWEPVELPHDWSIKADFGATYPAGNAGGALPGGIGWYSKEFKLPTIDQGKCIQLHFGGIYRYAEIWINGVYLGKKPNGYLSFTLDLTPYLKFGNQYNRIAVRVDNSKQPNSRWYSGSGIYRDVYLVKTNPIYLDDQETFITTPEARGELGQLKVLSKLNKVSRSTGVAGGKKYQITVWDPTGNLLLKKTGVEKDGNIDELLRVDKPKLWSTNAPNLYRVQLALLTKNNTIEDQIEKRIGFRTIRFDAKTGFYLNGEALKILGVCMHHDLGALGAAFNKSAAKRQLVMMKEMGANAIRTAHNPPAEELLDLCDEMGILVYNEAFDMWKKRKNKFDYHIDFPTEHLKDLEAFVRRDRNHASVILWSIGNEIREQFDSTGIALTQEMAKLVKSLDPTRPVTAALTENNYAKNFIAQAEALDVLGFNYKHEDYDKLPVEFKNIPLLASETVSALETRAVYDKLQDTIQLWPASSKDKYVVNGNPDFTVSAYDNVAAYWGTSHEKAWLAVNNRPFLAGTFVWTGFDYLGEPVPYPYPARSSYYGIVDLAGIPKDVYYMYKSEWTDKDVLHLLPHWNWKAGDSVDVWAYYNKADDVELFLNGKSLGTSAKTTDRLHASWKVPFEKGELKVVKKRDGKIVQEASVHTATEAHAVKVSMEHEKYATGESRDLYFVTATLVDQAGQSVLHNDQEIEFIVKGSAKVLGTDNGFQADLRGLHQPKRKTFKGKALGIIQKTTNTPCTIIIRSALGDQQISI
ncbi:MULTISPECIES: glycoside hydrolase family 2 TIM barrel-domain containing protein [unclassified Sphingobacterium]|uniref:glycoside hydrolase family 2 TIM barrel-domain containing protein n=1 Tax=unclassified Sphingobacterium TaxID=2609468 RepID=UPI0025D340B8|nr:MULTISPECIES: glycoside hydrolase family 2 TIM barrel-domain containing protein [unclassified Sphingobacterium]